MMGSESLRFSALNRFLILQTMQLGARLIDIILVVVFMEIGDTKNGFRPKREGYVNDFAEILDLVTNTDLSLMPHAYLQLVAKTC